MNPENHYTERLSLTEGQLQQVKKQIFRISMLRLALFIAGIAGLYFFYNQTTLLIVCICLTFLPLFILVKIHNRFFIRKEWLETQARIIQEVMHNRQLSSDIRSLVKGLMIESYIEEGNQSIGDHIYGKSITDPCLGWEDSKQLIYDIAEMNAK